MKRVLMLAILTCGACGAASPRREQARPDEVYRPRAFGTIDLDDNPSAQHCSTLTGSFVEAYRLQDSVQALRVSVSPDGSRAAIVSGDRSRDASVVFGTNEHVCAFWHHEDWTLAITLDRRCVGGRCPTEVSLIEHGASTDRPSSSKLCFERWAGSFEREGGKP